MKLALACLPRRAARGGTRLLSSISDSKCLYSSSSSSSSNSNISGSCSSSSSHSIINSSSAPVHVRNSLGAGPRELTARADGRPLSWYSCGPTVYDCAHLGHARTYVCTDILRRVMAECHGLDVFYALGITDIDDKIMQRAQESGRNWKELALYFESDFKSDMRALGVAEPDVYLPVTEHVTNIIDYIKGIIDEGYGYVAEDGVYFSVSKLGDRYAPLGQNRGGAAEEEVGQDDSNGKATGKTEARDFALWKNVSSAEKSAASAADSTPAGSAGPLPLWDSPWGLGRPGWHIECSAMSHACFGSSLDIHSGGIDLLFPHHTNEIAQW
jgi:cysteinyl-tRNA synthetase